MDRTFAFAPDAIYAQDTYDPPNPNQSGAWTMTYSLQGDTLTVRIPNAVIDPTRSYVVTQPSANEIKLASTTIYGQCELSSVG
ncbi:hypothetical protein GCM10009817_39910 [Terrabacter lapilli]|uniref:Uncharacterized protein n=1 Tax=Terrabacter lapilli TaxID=436231 RepID=A0ABP5E8W8_9MICO